MFDFTKRPDNIFEESGFTCHVWDDGIENGKNKIQYRFYDNGKLIFESNDSTCLLSPIYGVIDTEVFYELFGFLTLQPDYDDSELFAYYTPEQLAWAKSDRCDELYLILSDYEEERHIKFGR